MCHRLCLPPSPCIHSTTCRHHTSCPKRCETRSLPGLSRLKSLSDETNPSRPSSASERTFSSYPLVSSTTDPISGSNCTPVSVSFRKHPCRVQHRYLTDLYSKLLHTGNSSYSLRSEHRKDSTDSLHIDLELYCAV